jgi:plastocyanin
MPNLSGKRYLPLVALLGAAAAVLPTLASGQSAPSSASFMAVDSTGPYGSAHSWQSSSGGNQATIAQGGTVTFSYSVGAPPQGSSTHNVDFTSAPATPTCTQTQGSSSGSVPPLPHTPTGPGWAGSCTFTTPGTYQFWCDLHMASMAGTVVVQSSGGGTTGTTTTSTSGTTTTSTSTSTTGTPPGTTNATTGSGGGSPTAAAALGAVALASSQKGSTVRGSAAVGQAGSTLRVDLTAGAASAGHTTRHGVGAGRVSFAVPLNVKARRALLRHARLALTVKIRVTTPAGRAGTTTRHVTLHR